MGFVTLGLFTLNQQGIEGAILLMVSHGIIAASLFLLIGFIYDRHHTREIGYYGGVVYTMPLYGSIMLPKDSTYFSILGILEEPDVLIR